MAGLLGGGSTSTTAEKVASIRIQTASFGKPIPLVYGTTRMAANLFWYDNFQSSAQTQSAGKGGGGSSSTTYTYTADIMFGLCEGQIEGIGNIAREKTQTTLSAEKMTLFTGARPQSEWSYLSTKYPNKALPYFGTAYIAVSNLSLGSDGTLPNYSFEVKGLNIVSGGMDSNPADIVNDLLTNQYYGAGISSSLMGSLTLLRNYCTEYGMLLSLGQSTQEAVFDIIKRILQECNSEIVYSEGMVKFIPYGETAKGTYSPNITPIYDLNDDDFLDVEQPIKVTRSSPTDAYNSVKIEFYNRANNYNVETDEEQDLANIDLYGYRPQDVITMHEICDSTTAHTVAQLLLNRTLYVRNTYEFRVTWRYSLLEPMDVITITDSILGLNKYQVRIVEISENSDYELTIIAEDFPFGVSTASLYPKQNSESYAIDYGISGGNCNPLMIFEAPDVLSNKLEIWIGASGGATWGGADIYVSYDNSSYALAGSIIVPTKQGTVTTDSTTSMSINMGISSSDILSGSSSDYANNQPLYVVNNEFLTYQNATLTGSYQYTITPLKRGIYGSTTAVQPTSALISKVDESAVVKVPFTNEQLGTTLYVKAVSKNIYGGAIQDLATVSSTAFTIHGVAYQSPLPDVSVINSYYKGTTTYLKWDGVSDYRAPIDYEIRYGTAWDQAQVLGRVSSNEFLIQSNGQYWIKAHYTYSPTNADIYSTNATGLLISGATITNNVIATWDEKATSWAGTLSGSATIISTNLICQGISAGYEVPASHIIDVGVSQSCNVSLSYTATGYLYTNTVDSWTDLDTLASIDGTVGTQWSIKPQIAISDNAGTFGAWQDFYPTDYIGRKFKIRLIMTTDNSTVYISVSGLTWSVDVPDRVDTGNNVAIASGGTSITYARPFQAVPNTQITIINATAGDDVILTSQTVSGFTVQVKNAGSGVARDINWLSQGY